jgi:hypothetical protein|tara:strand:- start:440 stop:709 length:270 start_codon:yes stop_codon:yes gene_type:complete
MTDPKQQDAWLVRPSSIRILWRFFWMILTLTVLAQLVIKIKGSFGFDSWIGFGAVFGFISCLLMVLFAKALGMFLKRDQEYYLKDLKDD